MSMKKYITGSRWRVYILNPKYTEGGGFPRFYLPVFRPSNMDAIELWIFPLAPFVLLFRILHNVFWQIWNDLMEFQHLQSEFVKIKKQLKRL